jgi:hypothetical protein
MQLYEVIRTNIALNNAADFMTLISGATRSSIIVGVDAEGDGNTSSYNEFGLYRVATAGTTGSAPVVPTAPSSPNMTGTTPALAFSGTVNTAWTGQPTLGALLKNCPVNSNGQRFYWRAMPNYIDAIDMPGGANAAGSISVRGINGAGNVSIRITLIEI